MFSGFVISYSMMILIVRKLVNNSRMCSGFFISVLKLIDMLMLIKNSFSSNFLKGLILFFSV